MREIIIDENLSKNLKQTLFEIGDFDYDSLKENTEPGIFDGYGGLSLFFYHLYRFTGNDSYRDKYNYFFEKGFNSIDTQNLNLSYGASGIMWLLNLYIQKKTLSQKYNHYLDSYDRLLAKRVDEYSLNIDTMHGLLSIANYLLGRKSESSNICLNRILEIIDNSKINLDNGVAWKGNDTVDIDSDEQYFSFGYAHGIPAILWFLCKFIQKGVRPEKSKVLFEKGMNYLLENRLHDLSTFFPAIIMKNQVRQTSRIAFCYGDLGIAAGLTTIATTLKNKYLLNEANKVAVNTARLALMLESYPNDIGLCHGAAGNGFLFSRLYKVHREEILKEAAIHQFRRLIDLKKEGSGIAGFTSIDYDSKKETFYNKDDKGFINGTSGVGLSIISFLTNEKIQYWDNLLHLK